MAPPMLASISPSAWVALESYTLQLREFIEALPHGRLDELRERCRSLLESTPHDASADVHLAPSLQRIRAVLVDLHTHLDDQRWPKAKAYVLGRCEELSRSYEHWRRSLGTHAQSRGASSDSISTALKPLMGARTFFHVAMGLLASGCYQWLLTRWQAMLVLLTLLTVFGSLEITRRILPRWNDRLLNSSLFKPIARPDEYFRINSSTYYLIALCLVTSVFAKQAVIVGILILAFADPAAAWIGKRHGRLKLYGEKSVVGTVAFATTSFLVAALYLAILAPEVGAARAVLAAVAASLAGAGAELVSTRVDDNLTVPIASVIAASLIL
jgi:dolichol kinase